MQAEFRGADFFPVHIFPNPNRDSDSVKNSESNDIKILTRFPGNPILEILIKNIIAQVAAKCAGGFS